VVGGTAAAVVVWLLAKYVFDAEMRARGPGSTEPTDINVVMVIVSALVWALLGWGLLAILERFVARARTIWLWLAIAGFVLSFISPLTAQGRHRRHEDRAVDHARRRRRRRHPAVRPHVAEDLRILPVSAGRPRGRAATA
jgi:undecaprenyl pyrophosphate phosphatase UppP